MSVDLKDNGSLVAVKNGTSSMVDYVGRSTRVSIIGSSTFDFGSVSSSTFDSNSGSTTSGLTKTGGCGSAITFATWSATIIISAPRRIDMLVLYLVVMLMTQKLLIMSTILLRLLV